MLSNEFIQKIRKCGVRGLCEFLTELHETSPGTWMGKCPFPDEHKDGEDKSPSFMVKVNDEGIETWCCHSCHCGEKDGVENFGSDNIAFMQWVYNKKYGKRITFVQAVKKIAEAYGIPMEGGAFSAIYQKNKNAMEKYEAQLTPFVRTYLYDRGLDDDDIQKWHLGFDGDRITMPVFNSVGEVTGFSNRAFSKAAKDSGRKYMNTPEKFSDGRKTGFFKRGAFYGIQFVNKAEKRIFIFEGQFDAIIASKYGIPNAVAAMTCHLTSEQAEYIAKQGFIPVVCFDPDEAGIKGAMKTMEVLQDAGVADSRVLFLPDERDMADLGHDLKDKLVETVMPRVMPFYQYLLKGYADEMDAAVLAKQNELMPKVSGIIASIKDETEKELAMSFVHQRFKIWAA